MPGHFAMVSEILKQVALEEKFGGRKRVLVEIGSARIDKYPIYKNISNLVLSSDYKRVEKLMYKSPSEEERVPMVSTEAFVMLCKEYNLDFISVDMDEECLENAKKIAQLHDFKGLVTVHGRGEKFLEDYSGKIDFLYLDGFDYYHGDHSAKRQAKYKKYLNTKIEEGDEECHKMHKNCCISAKNKITKDGVIVIDDIIGKNKKGKGFTAVPYLSENGFEVKYLHPVYDVVVCRRKVT